MSEAKPLGRRAIEPPLDADMGTWAAGEVTKHEELCGLRYEAIEQRMERIEGAVKAINDRFNGAVKYVLGILASLGVALIMMFLNDSKTRAQADQSDKREMRARLSLLTQQLAAVRPNTLVVTPPGGQAQTVPAPVSPPLDADDLSDATGGKGK